MAFLKCAFLFVALFAMVAASPIPEPGFWGPKHEHIVVHVPYKVHTVHHHHVHKVHVPIVKEIPIIKEVHFSKSLVHDHHDHHDHHAHYDHHDHHGWW